MGVQILNKDVSVISGVMGKAKASIGNIFGKTGWSGGGGSNIPSPTPNWANIAYFDGSGQYTYSKQQIQGIGSSITLNITWSAANELWYLISTTEPGWNNGGTDFLRPVDYGFTLITTGANIVVSNNQWVSFATEWGYNPPFFPPGTTTATVKNVSDSNTTLDTFTITGTG